VYSGNIFIKYFVFPYFLYNLLFSDIIIYNMKINKVLIIILFILLLIILYVIMRKNSIENFAKFIPTPLKAPTITASTITAPTTTPNSLICPVGYTIWNNVLGPGAGGKVCGYTPDPSNSECTSNGLKVNNKCMIGYSADKGSPKTICSGVYPGVGFKCLDIEGKPRGIVYCGAIFNGKKFQEGSDSKGGPTCIY